MSPTSPPRKSPVAWVIATILLAAAIFTSLWLPIYERSTPKLGAFPFFYWYQLLLVPAVAVVSWIAYLLLRTPAGTAADPASERDGKEAV